MRYESNITSTIDALEIQYFRDDPDDDPERWGDGYYFRSPGDTSWNGPWLDPSECRQICRQNLEAYYRSLERKMQIYERAPRAGCSRFFLEFDGILDPIALDVPFPLWSMGPGWPQPMSAIIDAPSADDVPALLEGTVIVRGEIAISETSGTIEEIRLERGLIDLASRR